MNPKIQIDFKLKEVVSELDGPSMWHFLSVFKSIILTRGEKSEDLLLIEEGRLNDLKKYRPE